MGFFGYQVVKKVGSSSEFCVWFRVVVWNEGEDEETKKGKKKQIEEKKIKGEEESYVEREIFFKKNQGEEMVSCMQRKREEEREQEIWLWQEEREEKEINK